MTAGVYYRTESGAAVFLPDPIDIPDDCYDADCWQSEVPPEREGYAALVSAGRTVGATPDGIQDRLKAYPKNTQSLLLGFLVAFLVVCLVAGVMLRAARPAAAQQPTQLVPMMLQCGPYAAITKHLAKKFGEAPIAFGLQSGGNVLQVYSSEENGTWTVVSTTPTGQSCIIAAGRRFEILPVGQAM